MNTRKKYAVGIDLGTTRSVVAHLDADGRPCTIANAEGDLTTPSVVFFDSEGVIVGKEATKAAEYEPERVAQFAKRSMGELACERTVCGHKLPPEVVQALILRKLVADASLKLGEITDAVITVPAYFNEPRRKATQDAGRLIGLNVLDIINEPTAAAISFGVQQGFLNAAGESGQKETILVYDLGGGTFDVTLMDIEGQSYTALATAGDVYLGGIDWDMRIVDFVAEQFQEKFDIDPRQNEQARQILLAEAADAKHALTARSSVNIQYAFDGNRLRIPLSREQFEELTGDLVDRTILTVRRLLREAKKQWNEITRLMLVGGSTRMPMIQTVLENESGLPVDRSMSPDEAVAHGAAIYAGLLAKDGSHPRPGMSVVNVNSHDLGVLGTEPETGMQRRKVLIGRNTSLPAVGTSKFVTRKQGQRSVAVTVVEGGDSAGKNATLIGKCVVDDLPPDLPAGTPVKVSFNYGANGRLTVGASLPGTGRHARMVIERSSGLSADMLEHWRQRIESGQFFDDEEAVGEVEDLDADLNLDESAAPRADDSAIMSDEDVMEVEQFEDEATATEESPPPPSSSQTTAAGPDAPKKNAAAKDAALQDFLKGLGR